MNMKEVKVGDKVRVIFSVGIAHPLYNKVVDAEITMIGGYNGKCIEAKTIEPVHHPEDPEGIFVYKNNKLVGCKARSAFDAIHTGWVEEVKY